MSLLDRARSGELRLETPGDLLALLTEMAKNSVRDAAAYCHAEKRDVRRVAETPVEELPIAGHESDPAEDASARDAACRFIESLSDLDRKLMRLRYSRLTWEEVGREMGRSSQAVRKRYCRIMRRLVKYVLESGGGVAR